MNSGLFLNQPFPHFKKQTRIEWFAYKPKEAVIYIVVEPKNSQGRVFSSWMTCSDNQSIKLDATIRTFRMELIFM